MDGLALSLMTGVAAILLATLFVLGSYFLARRLLHPGTETDRTADVANSGVGRRL